MQIDPNEYPPYYQSYISRVRGDLMKILMQQMEDLPRFMMQFSEAQLHYRYAAGKWSPKEVLGHLIDTERIMAYRALRFTRKDQTPLPGFEENDYVQQADFNTRSIEALCAEFETMRMSHLFLFDTFNKDNLNARGQASGQEVSVRALLYIIAGHVQHHMHILRERYLDIS